MKVILPVAGIGTRLRPHTHFLPKALLPVAGNTILGHILHDLKDMDVSEYMFVTGYKSEEVEQFISETYSFQYRFVPQSNPQGLGEAIAFCEPFLNDNEPVLIILGDTLFKADLQSITSLKKNVLCARKVEDPRRFGVALTDDSGKITKLVEKPADFVSDLALVGIYYIEDVAKLKKNLRRLLDENIKTRGEYQFTDVLEMMIQEQVAFYPEPISEWLDCGKPETLVASNEQLLQERHFVSPEAKLTECTIVEPCYIGPGVQARGSRIGPNVSLFKNCKVIDSTLSGSVIDKETVVENSKLESSILGKYCRVLNQNGILNLGNHSTAGTLDPA
jgi:glucose-1-phosphate thymidylyltransferase